MMKELAGTGALIRLILRRDRILLPIWILWLTIVPVATAASFAELYPTAVERQAFADTVGSCTGRYSTRASAGSPHGGWASFRASSP